MELLIPIKYLGRSMDIIHFLSKQRENKLIGDWLIAEGEKLGLPVSYRYRKHIPHDIDIDNYPVMLSIIWKYESHMANGLPTETMANLKMAFEDVMEKLDKPENGYLMVACTGESQWEWMWYVRDSDQWLSSLKQRLAGHPTYPIEIFHRSEKDWKTWKAIREGIR